MSVSPQKSTISGVPWLGMVSGIRHKRMKNILVIDDSSEIRGMVEDALTLVSGYSVRLAKNGREGIQMVIAQRPDLILCDVTMPSMDGYRTLEAIRKCSGTAAIPFILMTGETGANDFRRGMASGADDFLMKPFTLAELDAAVRSRFEREAELQAEMAKRVAALNRAEVRRFFGGIGRDNPAILSALAAKLHEESRSPNQTGRKRT